MNKFKWLDCNFLLFADPEIGIASSYYQVNESAGSVEVVVMATSTGLSGYVTLQTEDGNATGEQLYIPINFVFHGNPYHWIINCSLY